MVDDVEPAESDFGASPFAPTGPRRSTYTPPEPPREAAPVTEAPTVQEAQPSTMDAADLPPSRPARESLPLDVLTARLSDEANAPGNTLDVMEQLEQQLRLRESEAREFSRWESSMLALGTPEAKAEVASARNDFGDVLGVAVEAVPVSAPAPTPALTPASTPAPLAEPVHTVRVDEAPEVELNRAPAPMTAPVADIPPPPGIGPSETSPEMPPALEAEEAQQDDPQAEETLVEKLLAEEAQAEEAQAEEAQIDEPPVLHALVEPEALSPLAASGPFDFDALLAGTPMEGADDGTSANGSDRTLQDVPEQGEVDDAPISEPLDGDISDGDLSNGDLSGEDIGDTGRVFADLVGPLPVTAEGVAILPEAAIAAVGLAEPMASPRVATEEQMLLAEEATSPPAFRVEEAGLEPTSTDQKVGRAARLFWLWFAANSSIVSVAFGGILLSLGMSLRQAIVATLAGVAISFLPLGLGTLAGKWTGQPTMVVSRATFGLLGNILPAVLALLTRLFWGALLLWFLAGGTASIIVGAELGGSLSTWQITIIALAVGFLLALVIAFFGYGLIARVQLVLSIVSGILVVGLIVITWPSVSLTNSLTVGDGPWILVLTGAVLVFSFVGLVWAVSSADLARYQRPGSSGAASMLWSTFGSTLPAFLLIAYGALLAASNPEIATGLIETPLDTIALLMPTWYPVPLVAALALSLLSGIVISIYSGGFALQAIGATMRRSASVVVVGVALAAMTALITLSVGDFSQLIRDVATSLAVPVAAWAGIFASEMMIRSRTFDSASLLKRGGIYPDVNWVNLAMLVVASAVGFGLTTATVGWLDWQGYLFSALGVPLGSDLAGSDLGVFVALLLGILTPIVAGIPAIRRQERGVRRGDELVEAGYSPVL